MRKTTLTLLIVAFLTTACVDKRTGSARQERPPTPPYSEEWAGRYRDACEAGDPSGCWRFGNLLLMGAGVLEPDDRSGADAMITRAIVLFTRSCDAGDLRGCVFLGKALTLPGPDFVKNSKIAVSLFQRACEGGEAEGCSALPFHYFIGAGVALDASKALAFAMRACDGGIASDCKAVGDAYRDSGFGELSIEPDRERALVYYKRACAGGDADACDQVIKGVHRP